MRYLKRTAAVDNLQFASNYTHKLMEKSSDGTKKT